MQQKWTLGKKYTRAEIAAALGGSEISYLPMEGGTVVCGCFTYEDNPQLPDIILPGTRPDIEAEAAELRKGYAIPVFAKLASKEWLHVGNYRVVSWSTDAAEIGRHQVLSGRKRSGRDKISQILHLEPVGEYFDLNTMTKMTERPARG